MTPDNTTPSPADFADAAVQWLCELPDRTSPEDWPEACLVTGKELHAYLVEKLTEWAATEPSPAPPDHGESAADGVVGWKCFHCDEVFTNREAARLHFGSRAEPFAATLCTEPDIARRLRDVEDQAHEMFQLKTRAEERLAAKAEPIASVPVTPKICAANRTADPPQDCDWPFCGCDEHANKVLEAVGNVRDERQARMMTWGSAAFGQTETISVEQRGYRHMEEAIEAGQAAGCARDKVHKLVDHIFDREPGEISQEIGGSGITLLMLAAAAGLSADAEEDREMRRVLSKPIEHFTARNKAKNDAGFVARNVDIPTRKFPILDSSFRRNPSRPKFVTWALLQPHEKQAVQNHDQSLEELARRGGLDWVEMYAIVMDKDWHKVSAMTEDEAAQRVIEMERTLHSGNATIPVLGAAQLREKATDG